MGSGQSIISKEDMEAYKQLTYFTEAEIKNCLQKFSELLDPATPMKSVHDPQARVLHENVVNGLQELKVNPFAKRICQVFSPNSGQLMTFEEFLDMLSSLRSVVDAITGTDETAFKSLDETDRKTVVRNVLRETDLNRTGQISLAEFKQMVVRSPDFVNNFRIRL